MSGETFSHQNDQLNCPECGHELDLPPPRPARSLGQAAMTEMVAEQIPAELIERIRREAMELCAGEDDPVLRNTLYESAYQYLYARLYEARIG